MRVVRENGCLRRDRITHTDRLNENLIHLGGMTRGDNTNTPIVVMAYDESRHQNCRNISLAPGTLMGMLSLGSKSTLTRRQKVIPVLHTYTKQEVSSHIKLAQRCTENDMQPNTVSPRRQ